MARALAEILVRIHALYRYENIYKYMHTDLTGTPPDRGRNALQGPRQGESCAPC